MLPQLQQSFSGSKRLVRSISFVSFIMIGLNFECPEVFVSGKIMYQVANISPLAETLTDLGEYTLILRTLINESKADSFGGRELPSYKLNFTIKGLKTQGNFSLS